MKKVWNDATLVELDITATAGGPVNNHEFDSEEYFDAADNMWKRKIGIDPSLS